MKELKNYFFWWLVFLWTVLLWFITFAAWTNIPNQVTGTTITPVLWNQMVDNINTIWNTYAPPWMVAAFFWPSCPTWWTKADGSWDETKTDGSIGSLDLRWEFIRWLDDGKWVDTSRWIGTSQSGTSIPYIYVHRNNSSSAVLVSPPVTSYPWDNIGLNPMSMESSTSVAAGQYFSTALTPTGGFNSSYYTTRPRNVALLYCVKQ